MSNEEKYKTVSDSEKTPEPSSRSSSKPKEEGSKTGWIILSVVLIVALAVGLGLGLGLREDDDDYIEIGDDVDYDYLENGADWGDDCATGSEQTPINIVTADLETDDALTASFDFTGSSLDAFKLAIKKLTVIAETAPSTLTATPEGEDENEFEAIQFHFHAPSEHTIDGIQYDLELHIVHSET